MATEYSAASGNFTAAATWGLVDPTSYQNTEAASTGLTVAFVASQNFTPGTITINGLAVKVATRAGTSGTWTIQLFDVTAAAAVAATVSTINITDVDPNGGGFYLFKFATNVTLTAGHVYNVQAKASAANLITLFRSATAGDWARALRTTTTQAPGAGDTVITGADFTGPSTSNPWTVTMNNPNNTTTYGEIEVGKGGTLTWSTTGNTYLKVGANVNIYGSGIYSQGTSGTPIPSGTTAQLEIVCATPVQFGFQAKAGSIVNFYGATKTVYTTLAADAASAATSVTTSVSTGWFNGDDLAFASTDTTNTHAEDVLMTANAVGTTLSIQALTNLHSGTAPTQGHIANLTRNVQVFSLSATNNTFINIAAAATFNAQYTEFYNMGSATALSRGIDIATNTTGSCSIQFCSMHDFTAASALGINLNSTTNANVTLSNNVFWNTNSSAIITGAFTSNTVTISGNLAIFSVLASGDLFSLNSLKGTFTNNIGSSGNRYGCAISDATATSTEGTFSGNTFYSNGNSGINLVAGTLAQGSAFVFSTTTLWRNGAAGIIIGACFNLQFNTMTAFGNVTAGINMGLADWLFFRNLTFNGGTTFVQPVGVLMNSSGARMYFDSSTFGVTTAHTTADLSVGAVIYADYIFRTCTFSSPTLIHTPTNLAYQSTLGFQRLNGTAGNHYVYKPFGTIALDTVRVHNSPYASKCTPNSLTTTLDTTYRSAAVANTKFLTFQVYVWLSSATAGDSATYNGAAPNLRIRSNSALGITSGQILATGTTATGTWQLLSGVTPAVTDDGVLEAYVDCTGTTGFMSIADWKVF
jgi:hypothetical protein